MADYRMETLCVQGGYTPGNGEPRQIPIVQSTTFKYLTGEDMGKLFDLEAPGYFYTRLQNPTNDYVAAKIAALEGGTAALLTSSGQAANFFAMFNLAGLRHERRHRHEALQGDVRRGERALDGRRRLVGTHPAL